MLFRPPKQDFYNIKNVKDVTTDMEDFSLIQPTSWFIVYDPCEGYQVWNSLSKDVENIGELN